MKYLVIVVVVELIGILMFLLLRWLGVHLETPVIFAALMAPPLVAGWAWLNNNRF